MAFALPRDLLECEREKENFFVLKGMHLRTVKSILDKLGVTLET